MVLDSYRRLADKFLAPMARAMIVFEPNSLTWAALLCAVVAGLFFYYGGVAFLSLAIFFLFLNAGFDALDGRIARLRGKTMVKGDFLDHVLDRYADIFIIGGIMLGPYCNFLLGFFALLGVLLTSYMGTQAQAVGVGREYGGVLGRADRLMVLLIAALLQLILDPNGINPFGTEVFKLKVIEYAMLLFAVLGNITAIQRAIFTWRKL